MVGVVCQEVEEGSCDEDHFHCKSGECIEIEHLCDGIQNNCQDNSDEDIRMCSLRIQVRLTDKEHYGDNSGLLEVRHKGVWGTVCTDNFEMGEATVFCRMLGYDGEATIGE